MLQQNDFNPNLYDIDLERSLSNALKHGPVVEILVEQDHWEWVMSARGLIRMPAAVNTSIGMLRYYRRPLPGEIIDSSDQSGPDQD